MTDCIRSLLINCCHLKELFILSNITFHYQSYFKILFSIITNACLRFLYILLDLQGRLTIKRGKGYHASFCSSC